jgi:FMN phosphatase YigB (HAD superfamily)
VIKTVLFDLDNTLLLYDEMKFAQYYFPKLTTRFSDLFPADKFADRLLTATLQVHQNEGSKTNLELFLDLFCDGLEVSRDAVWKRFSDFYEQDFDWFKDIVVIPDKSLEVMRELLGMKLRIAIATNPILPLHVQMKRLAWAGLAGIDFALVTNIENMNYCKPNLGFYKQVCQILGEKPEDCLMVGDDPANDMVAAKIGMKTYQTMDSLDQVEKPLQISKQVIGDKTEGIPPADFKGLLAGVPQAVASLLNN